MSMKILSTISNAPGVPTSFVTDRDEKGNHNADSVMSAGAALWRERPLTPRVCRKFSVATPLGTLSVRSSIDGNGFGLMFRSPKWLARAAYDVEWRGALSSLAQINIRLYNLRPNDSPIFERLKMGDFKGVTQLLDNGQASLFDRDEDGQSLLHVSIQAQRPIEVVISYDYMLNESSMRRAQRTPPSATH